MTDFIHLDEVHSHFKYHTELTGDAADYFRSAEYLEKLDTLKDNTSELVRLTIGYLNHVALDYRKYSKPEDVFADTDGRTCLVNLQFFHIVSVMPPFQLDVTTPEAAALLKAVTENLTGRKNKAARAFERQRLKQSQRYARIASLARPAFMQIWEAGQQELKSTPEYFYNTVRARTQAQAEEARDRVYIPLRNKQDQRLGFLLSQACDTAYQSSFHDMPIAFATTYLFETRNLEVV